MKIAILVSMFPPRTLGGTEIATQNIAKHLVKERNEVHILTSQDKGLAREGKKDGFFIYRISYPRIKVFGVILFWIKLFLCLRKVDPEIVHSQGIQMAIPCFLAKRFLKKPYIVYCRGSDVYLPWRFKRLISKLVLKNADAIIALTEDMKREIKKIYGREIFVISNGINLKRFEGLSKNKMRDKLRIKKDIKIILFVGGLKQIKGMKYLIEAINIIKEKIPKIKLLLVGYGKERKNLEGLVKGLNLENYVTFIGKVPNEKIPEYMANSDIFVLPSLSESFGIVNLEAMACGLPIVASRVGGIPEVVKDGENGFLVKPKNPEQIAEKVLLLLENEKLREKISNNNRKKAKKYNWKEVVKKLEKVYLKILNSKEENL